MTDAVIIEKLGKSFRRYDPQRPQTLQEAVLNGLRRLGPKGPFLGPAGPQFLG